MIESMLDKYREVEDHFECVKCGAIILAATVAHPIWDGPFPCSGSGQCQYEDVHIVPHARKCLLTTGVPLQFHSL
jgi:hypothetical protein